MKLLMTAVVMFAIGYSANSATNQDPKKNPKDVNSKVWQIAELQATRQKKGGPWLEFLKRPDLSTGLYELKKGQTDGQQPHARDEIYYVVKGKAMFESEGKATDIKAGSVIYVRKQIDHRFLNVTEDLSLLVMFSAPSRQANGSKP